MKTQVLKAKILDLLIKGALTKKWRAEHKDTESASVLLEKIRAEKEKKLNAELVAKGIAKGKKPSAKVEIKAVSAEDQPFEIPESWKWCRLGDILYPMESKKPDGEKFTYIDIEAIDNVRNLIKKPKVLSVSEAPSRASRKLHYGDILFSMVRPYLRNIAFVEENYSEAIASTGFYVLTPIGVDNSFIFQFMLTSYVVNGLNKFATGDNSPSINNEHLKDFLLPLPPLEEQKELARLAASLLALVDSVDTSGTNLEALSKTAKAKVLDLLIKGNLTAKWRTAHKDTESASVLLEKIRAEKEKKLNVELLAKGKKPNAKVEIKAVSAEDQPFEIPASWCWCRLGDISDVLYGANEGAKEAGKYKLLRITDIQNDKVNWETVPFTNSNADYNIYLLKKGDLCFARTGTVGKSYLVDDSVPDNAIYASYLIRVRPPEIIDSFYIKCFFSSPNYWFQITDNTGGTAQPNCNGTKLSNLYFPLPPLEEQKELSRIAETLLSQIDCLADIKSAQTGDA